MRSNGFAGRRELAKRAGMTICFMVAL